jgi:hypothetical protein
VPPVPDTRTGLFESSHASPEFFGEDASAFREIIVPSPQLSPVHLR